MPQHKRFRTGDQALVRQINLSVIMHYLREAGPVSRADLADLTGLNKTTVSSLISELVEKRYVSELGLSGGRAGRPGLLLGLNPAAGHIIAAEVAIGSISVLCADFSAHVTWRRTVPVADGRWQEAIIADLVAHLRGAAGNAPAGSGGLLGVAVGLPGLVDLATGSLLFAPNLGWRHVPVRSVVEAAFDAPVFVDNEANMAALGEHYFGAARGYEDVLFISVSVGLGGAIVRGGRPYRGATGTAGEFGHMTMDPGGEPCNCGNRGCWETQVNPAALLRYLRRAIAGGTPSTVDPDSASFATVLEAARGGDAAACAALEEVGHKLGIGTASLVNAFNPSHVVLGGMISEAGEFLLPIVQREIAARALSWNAGHVTTALAKHRSDACVMGGVAAVLQAVLAQGAAASFSNID